MAFELFVILGLIVLVILAYFAGRQRGESMSDSAWREAVPEIRKDAIKRSKAVKGGQFAEQLAPYLPDFPYKPTECTFIGKPIDLLVFQGADEQHIEEVIFLEVKSGEATLSSQEQRLKHAIENKQVRWETYRVPQDLT